MKLIIVRTLTVCAAMACFFAVGNAASAAVIWHNGVQIVTDTVWHTGDIHVVADGSSLIVNPGKSLSIEPGVIIKFGYNSDIRIYGNFYASGTRDNMIQIVSLRDDSIGGDTNGDGSATRANFNDWRIIQVDGSRYNSVATIDLDYVVLKHINQSVIFAYKANRVKISNCNIVDNLGSILIMSNSINVSIIHSNIYNPNFCDNTNSTDPCHWNNSVRLYSYEAVDLTDNYWGSPDGPTYTTGTEPTVYKGVILANLHNVNTSYLPFATIPFEFGVKKLNPVILIPGILGSWPDIYGGWQLDPILHTYDDLLAALRLAGYEDDKTLFSFPYDWFQSNAITAQGLKAKINAVKAACAVSDVFDCSKIDLIGHSMGGLVARAYIEGNGYQDDVDQMIFVAVPQKGTPESYLMWESGDIFGNQLKNLIYKKLLEAKAALNGYKSSPLYDGVMHYVREMVGSVRELLPVYDYLRDKDSGELRDYPDNYPTNPFLENLNAPANLSKLSQVKITNILADNGAATLVALRVISPLLYPLDGKWEHGIPENYNFPFTDRGLELGAGDGTVPKDSNSNFNGVTDSIINNTSHLSVVSLAQEAIIKELTGQEPESIISGSPIDNLLVFRIFSPVDFQIIAPDGQRLGRDFYSTSTMAGISGGYYSGFSNPSFPEMVIIANPLPGEYQIKLIGTDSGGSYDFSTSRISGATSTESWFSGVILNGQVRVLSLDYDPLASSSPLAVTKSDITVQSAIDDVSLLFDRELLTNKNAHKKLIQQYDLLKLRVEIFDKLAVIAGHEIDRWRIKRQKEISGTLNDIDGYLQKLLADRVLKQLGYDIIKANNDYLINNWQ